jgi:predicted ATPase
LLQAKPYLQEVSIRSKPGFEPDFESYPFNIPAVRELGTLSLHADVTFFVGENGSGKSTLLEAIALAMGFGAEGGTKNVQLLHTVDSVSELYRYLKLIKSFRAPRDGYFLRAESLFNVATYMDKIRIRDEPVLHEISHGETFMYLLATKFRGKGLYLLDEPEAALSPSRQLAALSAIHQLVQDQSQFIIATHSPILLSYPHAKIMLFDKTGITEVAYEDTEHFAITRDFLNNYPKRLEQLLQDD